MAKRKIFIQLDTDNKASVFDGVVAVDAGVDHLFQYSNVRPEDVRDLVHGAMYTRGPHDLHNTAIFVGGSNVVQKPIHNQPSSRARPFNLRSSSLNQGTWSHI